MHQLVLSSGLSGSPRKGLRIGIVVARNNLEHINALFSQTYEMLIASGIEREHIQVVSVPASQNLLSVAHNLVMDNTCDAIICLGSVKTPPPYFNIPLISASSGEFQWVAFFSDVPVVFCVTSDQEQPEEQIGERGAICARTAIRMARVA